SGGGTEVMWCEDARGLFDVESLQPNELEAGCRDQLIDRAAQMAAAADDPLQGVQAVLPPGDAGPVATAMFQEEEPTTRPQHAANLLQRGADAVDRTEGPGRDDAIEASAVEREPGGVEVHFFQGEAKFSHAARHP